MIPNGAAAPGNITVNEFALASGSNAASTTETAAGTLMPRGGTGPYSYAISGSGTGSFGTMTIGASGSYSYTLTKATTDLVGNETETFTYTATDALGNTATNTVTVNITDDVPTANADTATITEGTTSTVAVASGVLSNDVLGADLGKTGGAVVGVKAGKQWHRGHHRCGQQYHRHLRYPDLERRWLPQVRGQCQCGLRRRRPRQLYLTRSKTVTVTAHHDPDFHHQGQWPDHHAR